MRLVQIYPCLIASNVSKHGPQQSSLLLYSLSIIFNHMNFVEEDKLFWSCVFDFLSLKKSL